MKFIKIKRNLNKREFKEIRGTIKHFDKTYKEYLEAQEHFKAVSVVREGGSLFSGIVIDEDNKIKWTNRYYALQKKKK